MNRLPSAWHRPFILLCLLTPNLSAAGDRPAGDPEVRQLVEVPVRAQETAPPVDTTSFLDLSSARVEIDGQLYRADDPALIELGTLYLTPDLDPAKTGLFHASRTPRPKADVASGLGSRCDSASKSPWACLFCTGYNLTGLCFYVPCGTGRTNMPDIYSFESGCSNTVLCTGSDCSGTCYVFPGTAVYNTNGVFHCGFCG